MAQVVDCLPSKCKALSSKPSTAKNNNKNQDIKLYRFKLNIIIIVVRSLSTSESCCYSSGIRIQDSFNLSVFTVSERDSGTVTGSMEPKTPSWKLLPSEGCSGNLQMWPILGEPCFGAFVQTTPLISQNPYNPCPSALSSRSPHLRQRSLPGPCSPSPQKAPSACPWVTAYCIAHRPVLF
jgi:hypothetical protein